MKVILLGHTGFVGSNVSKELEKNNIPFIGCSKSNGFDIREPGCLDAILMKNKPDFILNCAAHVGSLNYVTEQAATVSLDNTRMILSMYESIAKSTPNTIVINPIANCAYPAKADTFIEDEWWDGHIHRSVLSYGATRRLLWSVGESFNMQYNIRSINLLVPNMYGPFDSTDPNKAHALNALVSKFIKAGKNNEKEINVWGTGVAIREWLYAGDFGKILVSIIKKPNTLGLAEPLNIAQSFGLSVRELVAIIKEEFNFKGEIKWDTSKPDGAPKKVMDDKKFKKVFPQFEFLDFRTGIKETVKYYESIYPY